MSGNRRRRKGAAAILAIVFVAVFGVLSAAFYSLTVTSVATADSDQAVSKAQGAAESGLEYIRLLLSRPVNRFPSGSELATSSEVQAIYSSLHTDYGIDCAINTGVLRIPATGTLRLFPSQASQLGNFYATVVADPVTPHKINVTVVGSNGGPNGKKYTRTVSASCTPVDSFRPVSSPVDYGVAAQGELHVKNNVYVMTQDTGATNIADATMMSASSSVPSIIVDSNATVDSIIGTIWVTQSPAQVVSNIDTESKRSQTTVKVFTNPPYFEDYSYPEWVYTFDPSFAVYNTWAEFMADSGRTKKRVYIRGPASITINGSYGKTINASMVFGPGVTSIDMQGSSQVPTLIAMDPTYKYAIIAPSAHISYNGNTEAQIEGYIVAHRFSGNDNNSSRFTIRNGGLLTLDSSGSSCDLGQSDLYVYLPERTNRPVTTRFFTYRRYVMSYAGYQEN